jgi:hypothetical protein
MGASSQGHLARDRIERHGPRSSSGDVRDLSSDENALLYTRQQQVASEAIKAEIERRLGQGCLHRSRQRELQRRPIETLDRQ